MSVASWYYSNLIGDELSEDPVAFGVQPLQNAITPRAPVVNGKVALGQVPLDAEGSDELAVAKVFYVISSGTDEIKTSPVESAVTVDTSSEEAVKLIEEIAALEVNEVPTVKAVTKQVAAEPVEVAAVEEETASTPDESVALVETEVVTANVAAEEVEEIKEEVAAEPEKSFTEDVVVDNVAKASEVEAVIEEVASETAVVEETSKSVNEPPTSEVLIEEPVAEVVNDTIAAEVSAVSTVADNVEDKLGDVTADAAGEITKRIERMSSIPEDDTPVEENAAAVEEKAAAVVEEKTEEIATPAPDENVVSEAHEKTAEAEEAELTDAVKEVAATVVADESECETQSEISEAPAIDAAEPATSTKIDDEPESEIGEYMVIDAEAAAKNAAVVEAAVSKATQEEAGCGFPGRTHMLSQCRKSLEETVIDEVEDVEDAKELQAVVEPADDEATPTKQAVEAANDVVGEHVEMVEEAIYADTKSGNDIGTEVVVDEAEIAITEEIDTEMFSIEKTASKETNTTEFVVNESEVAAVEPETAQQDSAVEADSKNGDLAPSEQDPAIEMSESTIVDTAAEITTEEVATKDGKDSVELVDIASTGAADAELPVEVEVTKPVAEEEVATGSLTVTETPFVEPPTERILKVDKSEDETNATEKIKAEVETVDAETQTAHKSGVELIADVEAASTDFAVVKVAAKQVSVGKLAVEDCTISSADGCDVLDATTQTEAVVEVIVDEQTTAVGNTSMAHADDFDADTISEQHVTGPIQLEDAELEFAADDDDTLAVGEDAADVVEEVAPDSNAVAVEQRQKEEFSPVEEVDVADPDVEDTALEQDTATDEAEAFASELVPVEDEIKKPEDASATRVFEDSVMVSELPCSSGGVTSEMPKIVASLAADSCVAVPEQDAADNVAKQVVDSIVQDAITVKSVVANADSTPVVEIAAVGAATAATDIAAEEMSINECTDDQADEVVSGDIVKPAEVEENKVEAVVESDIVTEDADAGVDDGGSITEEDSASTSSSLVEIVIEQPTPEEDANSVVETEGNTNGEAPRVSASETATTAGAVTSDMPQIVASLALGVCTGLAATGIALKLNNIDNEADNELTVKETEVGDTPLTEASTPLEELEAVPSNPSRLDAEDDLEIESGVVSGVMDTTAEKMVGNKQPSVSSTSDTNDEPLPCEIPTTDVPVGEATDLGIIEGVAVDVEPQVSTQNSDEVQLVAGETETIVDDKDEGVKEPEVVESATKDEDSTVDKRPDVEDAAEVVKIPEEAVVVSAIEGAKVSAETPVAEESAVVESGAEETSLEEVEVIKDEVSNAEPAADEAAEPVVETTCADKVEEEGEEGVVKPSRSGGWFKNLLYRNKSMPKMVKTPAPKLSRQDAAVTEPVLMEKETKDDAARLPAHEDAWIHGASVEDLRDGDRPISVPAQEVSSSATIPNPTQDSSEKASEAERNAMAMEAAEQAIQTESVTADDVSLKSEEAKESLDTDNSVETKLQGSKVEDEATTAEPSTGEEVAEETVIVTESDDVVETADKVADAEGVETTTTEEVQVEEEIDLTAPTVVEESTITEAAADVGEDEDSAVVEIETAAADVEPDVVETADKVVTEEDVETSSVDKAVTKDVANVEGEVSAAVEGAVTEIESAVPVETEKVENAEPDDEEVASGELEQKAEETVKAVEEVATVKETAVTEDVAEEGLEPTEAETVGDDIVESEPVGIDTEEVDDTKESVANEEAATELKTSNEAYVVAVEDEEASASATESAGKDVVVAAAVEEDTVEAGAIEAERTTAEEPEEVDDSTEPVPVEVEKKSAVKATIAPDIDVIDEEEEIGTADKVDFTPTPDLVTPGEIVVSKSAIQEVVEAVLANDLVAPVTINEAASLDDSEDKKESVKPETGFMVDAQPINAVHNLIGRFEMFAKRNAAEAASSRVNSQANSRTNSPLMANPRKLPPCLRKDLRKVLL
ncbi:hypothetical protein BBP00_00000529 [Phytophthora kernoviae]|uniref:Uncharacterized protein n=1 Tax=Phytophthora kernoviae TaxID=325452 RepID=A0A3F2S2P7_9STRA|nr:hypothetical protein BBP00_00000529 [Phytophthora kernoviae]